MRTTPIWTVAAGILGLSAAGCSPQIIDTSFQSYLITLRGPDATLAAPGTENDPFGATQQYQITLKLWEDAKGTVPYGTSLKGKLPDEFKGFTPTIVSQFSGNKSSFVFGDGTHPLALPQLASGQKEFYVSSEIVGLGSADPSSSTLGPVARARCPVQKVSTGTSKVECHPFFGLIGKFNPVAAPKKARYAFASAVLSDGRVVIGGGKDATGMSSSPYASVEVWDPTGDDFKGTWTELAQGLSHGRYDLTAAATAGDVVLFAGGKQSESSFLTDLDKWEPNSSDGSSGVKALQSPLDRARAEHAMAPLANDQLVVAGGRSSSNGVASGGDLLTPNASPQPTNGNAGSRIFPCLVQVSPGSLVMCGGAHPEFSPSVNTCTSFDGSTWSESGRMSVTRGDAKCAAVDGAVYIVGGALAKDDQSTKIEKWTSLGISVLPTVAPGAQGLQRHAVAAEAGKVLVTGGYQFGDTTPGKGAFLIDTKTGDVTPTADMLTPRAQHQMVALGDGTIMVIGGKGGTGDIPGAEIYVVP